MLISQEKIDNSCGTLFGNYQGDKIPTSGWEFAINNANKPTINDNLPKIGLSKIKVIIINVSNDEKN